MKLGIRHAGAWHTGGLCALIGMGVLGIACDARKGSATPSADEAKPGMPSGSASAASTSATTGTAQKTDLDDGRYGEAAKASASAAVNVHRGGPPQAGGLMPTTPAVPAEQGITSNAPPSPMDNAPNRGFAAVRLDPNARYATTYRPGGAALAAFDAALAKGSIPAVYKDIVGDLGSRYAPAMAKPTSGAMAFQIDTERASVSPNGGSMNLRIAMRSSDVLPSRAQLSVHLVLDVSGSMSGQAIENARAAAATLVEKLEPSDDFSMVTFSNEAKVLVPDGPIGSRKQLVMAKIREVRAEGGTNISAGLDLGYKQAHSSEISSDAVRIVMLLSDGHANAGDTSAAGLAERSAHAFQDGIQTSSFGLGADFDAPLMASFADRGAGGYYYLADSTQIAKALTQELDARLVPVAQAVEVRVRLRPDVVPTKVFGSRELSRAEAWNVRQQEVNVDKQVEKKDGIKQDRQNDAEGGMRFFIPAFARDDRHAMLMTLQLPPGVGERSIASIEVKYKDRVSKKNVTDEIPVRIKYAASDADSAATWNASVRRTEQAFAAGDAILRAADLVDHGSRAEAGRILTERAAILKQASAMLNEPSLLDEGVRVARLSEAVTGSQAVQDPLPLAVMLRGSSYGYMR